MCNLTTDYIDDFMVRMAHHSTAIEGNSLTHGEAKSILIDNYLPRAMDMREMYEVLNYKNLIPFLVESIQGKVPISPEFCKKIHSIICNNAIEGTPGELKKFQIMLLEQIGNLARLTEFLLIYRIGALIN